MITDGESTNPQLTADEAAAARDKDITIYAVGVGDATFQELKTIATSTEEILTSMDFSGLSEQLNNITSLCLGGWMQVIQN